jgi:enoyl-CoA hydratase/carnithine racemase
VYAVAFLTAPSNLLQFILVADAVKENFLGNWSDMMKIQKPVIAAVSGFAVSAV